MAMEELATAPTEEEVSEGIEKFNDHQSRGHEIGVTHKVKDAYLYFMAKCSCGERFVANRIER